LDATHPGLFGLRLPWKGLIDTAVPRGSAIIAADRPDDALVGEAEWTVLFPDGAERFVDEPERVDLATPVIMQGLIEGKWLSLLLGTTAWAPASAGNNLLAEPGIATSLGAIEAGASGEIRLAYECRRAGEAATQVQTASLADLRGQNIVGLVRAVLRFCRDTGQGIDAIDLSAMGPRAAIVTDPRRIATALRFPAVPLPNPLNLVPGRRLLVMERVVRGILDDGVTVLPDHPMTISARDRNGSIVGQGSLVWRA
jgi:hypothetical protein